MKKALIILLLIALTLPTFAACDDTTVTDTSSEAEGETNSTPAEESSMAPFVPDKNAEILWNDDYSDGNIKSADDVSALKAFKDGNATDDYQSLPSGDTRFIFEGKESSRAVVLSEGYALTLPGNNITPDFSLGALRSKYEGANYVLTVSYENKNPYGANPNGWKTYYDEWLARYFVNNDFLMENSIIIFIKSSG